MTSPFEKMFLVQHFGSLGSNQDDHVHCTINDVPAVKDITVFSCLQNQVPDWWKTPLMGPAFTSGMTGAAKAARSPGCNGGVCYCNDKNYCNDRHEYLDIGDDCPQHLEHHKWDTRCKK